MLEYRLQARLRAYVHGIFPTKVSELDNDVPFLAAAPQALTEAQKRQLLVNQDAVNILSENFIRWDVPIALTAQQKTQARTNINAISPEEVADEVDSLGQSLQYNINNEKAAREDADSNINMFLGRNIPLQGFVFGDRIVTALNEVKKGYDNCADGETIVKTDTQDVEIKPLRAVAIKGAIAGGGVRKVVPQDIVNLESRTTGVEAELERIMARGGYITPYNFGWDAGTITSLEIGSQFEEQNPTEPTQKRTIAIVEEGQGNYPQGTNITTGEAKAKAHRFQLDLTAWAAEDIWNETYSKYKDDAFSYVLPKGKSITLCLDKGINPALPIGYWESIGIDANGLHVGLWITDGGAGIPQFNFGKFVLSEGIVIIQATAALGSLYHTMGPNESGIVYIWNNDWNSRDITLHALLTRQYELGEGEEQPTSGIDWEETFLYWKGHSPIEIFNGTSCINKFNGWIWEISNTPETTPSVFSWNLSDIGEKNIGYAQHDTAGVVKTKQTINGAPQQPDVPIYGVVLDENSRMYVDRLGHDMNLKADKAVISAAEEARDAEISDLYDTLVQEGWIVEDEG